MKMFYTVPLPLWQGTPPLQLRAGGGACASLPASPQRHPSTLLLTAGPKMNPPLAPITMPLIDPFLFSFGIFSKAYNVMDGDAVEEGGGKGEHAPLPSARGARGQCKTMKKCPSTIKMCPLWDIAPSAFKCQRRPGLWTLLTGGGGRR